MAICRTVAEAFPEALAPENRAAFLAELQSFQEGASYVQRRDGTDWWQGDVFDRVEAPERGDEGFDTVRARRMLISNSCDASDDNVRMFKMGLTFCAVIKLSRFRQVLLDDGFHLDRVDNLLRDIERQRVTNILCLPAVAGVLAESSMIFFDTSQSLDAEGVTRDASVGYVCSLSQLGFYLLLLKLATHFCRPWEGIERDR